MRSNPRNPRNPRHSQIITISDDMRSHASSIPAAVVGMIVVLVFGFTPFQPEGSAPTLGVLAQNLIAVFLIGWPIYAFTYVLWTHAGLQELSEIELVVHSRWALAQRRRLWSKLLGAGGPVSWTLLAAYVAIVFNVYLVTLGSDESRFVSAALGLINVIASWAVMVYSFALEFMRLDLRDGGSPDARQLEFDMEDERSFSDYLTFAVLTSTMTAALPGRAVTRAGWRLVRTNVIVAFAFNSVVVATLVSMILSYVL